MNVPYEVGEATRSGKLLWSWMADFMVSGPIGPRSAQFYLYEESPYLILTLIQGPDVLNSWNVDYDSYLRRVFDKRRLWQVPDDQVVQWLRDTPEPENLALRSALAAEFLRQHEASVDADWRKESK